MNHDQRLSGSSFVRYELECLNLLLSIVKCTDQLRQNRKVFAGISDSPLKRVSIKNMGNVWIRCSANFGIVNMIHGM